MKNLTRIKKIFIFCIALNVVIFGVYGFLFWDIRAKNIQVYELISEADRDIKKDETLRAIKLSLNNNQDFISQIDQFFVPRDGVVSFIDLLEKLGHDSGVELTIGSVSVESETKNNNDFKEILRLKLGSEGSWQSVFYFMSLVENLPYRIEFENASLVLAGASDSILFSGNGSRVRTSDEIWEGSFEVLVYKLR